METNNSSSCGGSNNKDNNVKQRIKDTTSEGIDYISSLPEVLLLHILSFLSLKECIVVSILSRQWKYLWTKISILNLNEIEIFSTILKRDLICHSYVNLPNQNSSCQCLHRSRNTVRSKFMEFVDRMLLLHSGSIIEAMRLSFLYDRCDGCSPRIDTWVRYAFTSNIKELELNFSDVEHLKFFGQKGLTARHPPQPYELPSGFFAPKRLKTFILNFCNFRASNFKTLFSLQKLHLKQLKVVNGSLEEIASKCPFLEDVILENCLVPDGFLVSKEDIMIKSFAVVHCSSTERLHINLSTPNLITQRIVGEFLNSASIQKATHLIEAQIGVCGISSNNAVGDPINSLLSGLNHCQSLTLSTWSIQDLLGFESLNPHLAHTDQENHWESETVPFRCLQNSPKEITVTGLLGRKNEVQMILFLLKNAEILKKVVLVLSRPNNHRLHSADEFERFEENLNQIYEFLRTFNKAEVSIHLEPNYPIDQAS